MGPPGSFRGASRRPLEPSWPVWSSFGAQRWRNSAEISRELTRVKVETYHQHNRSSRSTQPFDRRRSTTRVSGTCPLARLASSGPERPFEH